MSWVFFLNLYVTFKILKTYKCCELKNKKTNMATYYKVSLIYNFSKWIQVTFNYTTHTNTQRQLILQYWITSLLLPNFTVHISFTIKVHFKCFSDRHHSRCLKSQMWTGFYLKFGSLLKLFTTITRSILFIWCHFLFFILCSLHSYVEHLKT